MDESVMRASYKDFNIQLTLLSLIIYKNQPHVLAYQSLELI